MTDEIVDIIDENDQIISKCSKKHAHEVGLLHRCVIAEIIDRGQWTLVKQAGDRQDAGQFVSPVGGHVRSGEANEDALKREAFEEMGISGFNYELIGKAVYNRKVIGRKENHLFILYKIFTDQKPKLNHESVSFRKFTNEELKNEMTNNPLSFGDAWWFVVRKFFNEFL
jgi:8-oxo-dGTP pyrophosphatase MutT (NUDIX family)